VAFLFFGDIMKKDLEKLASFLKESGNIKEYNRLLGLIKESRNLGEAFLEGVADVAGAGLGIAGEWLTGSGDKKVETDCLHIAENFSSKIDLPLTPDQKESLNECKELLHPQKINFSDIKFMLQQYSEDNMEKAIGAYSDSVTFYVKFVNSYNLTWVDTQYSEFNIPMSDAFTATVYKAYLTQTGPYNYIYVKLVPSSLGQEARKKRIDEQQAALDKEEENIKARQDALKKKREEDRKILEESRKSYYKVERDSEEKKDDVFYYTKIERCDNEFCYIKEDGTSHKAKDIKKQYSKDKIIKR
jgi:hypothetical protein